MFVRRSTFEAALAREEVMRDQLDEVAEFMPAARMAVEAHAKLFGGSEADEVSPEQLGQIASSLEYKLATEAIDNRLKKASLEEILKFAQAAGDVAVINYLTEKAERLSNEAIQNDQLEESVRQVEKTRVLPLGVLPVDSIVTVYMITPEHSGHPDRYGMWTRAITLRTHEKQGPDKPTKLFQVFKDALNPYGYSLPNNRKVDMNLLAKNKIIEIGTLVYAEETRLEPEITYMTPLTIRSLDKGEVFVTPPLDVIGVEIEDGPQVFAKIPK